MCERLDKLYAGQEIDVIEGEAPGADRLARQWGESRGHDVRRRPADWDRYGRKSAGFIRNSEMVEECTEGVGFWDGVSTGTQDTIQKLKLAGKPCRVYGFKTK